MSQAKPILVMSRFVGSAWLKMAQLGWLSHFEPSRGITNPIFHDITFIMRDSPLLNYEPRSKAAGKRV